MPYAHRLLRSQELKAAQRDGGMRNDIDWRIAMKRGQLQAMPEGLARALYKWFEPRNAQVRAIVEHPFHVIKDLFGYRKGSYGGIAKNESRARCTSR